MFAIFYTLILMIAIHDDVKQTLISIVNQFLNNKKIYVFKNVFFFYYFIFTIYCIYVSIIHLGKTLNVTLKNTTIIYLIE